jgi:hypothetical protein
MTDRDGFLSSFSEDAQEVANLRKWALSRMVPPGKPRPGKFRDGVIQIWVTRACDKSCFSCTQGSNLAGKPGMISLKHFEEACDSLAGYWGVVGVFGGNPAMHPKFPALCQILQKYIPREQRGLWCNNPLGHGSVMAETFNPSVSNLNVHMDAEAFAEFRRDWASSMPFGLLKDSRHSPPFVAMRDVVKSEAARWRLIESCDINKHWSALIGVFRGQLRGYFCEIAGAQSMLHQDDPTYPDTGFPIARDGAVNQNWWKQPMLAFAAQVDKHCHECSVPLRGRGQMAQAADGDDKEQTSAIHAEIYRPKHTERLVQIVTERVQLGNPLADVTRYMANAER